MATDIKTWLETFPRFNWRSTFDFLLTAESSKAVEFNDYGIACFVKGLQSELLRKDCQEAMSWYEAGASQFDPLCLFRLHEIYIGEPAFNIEYNEKQSIIHLVYSALLSQFELFDYKVSFWQKFEGFWKKSTGDRTSYIIDLLSNSPAHYLTATGPLFTKLFVFYSNKNTFLEVLPELKNLQLSSDVLKSKFFYLLNAIFDFLAYTYNSGYSKSDLERYVEVVLDMMTDDLLFENFFQNYLTHLKLIKAKKKFGVIFQRRLESDCFWVWSFSFMASMKNHYLSILLSYEDIFTDGSLVLKWKNTSSWVNNFIGFCFEKGIGASKDLNKAQDLYEQDINSMPRVLFSRYRRILVLKEKREIGQQQPGQDGELDAEIENEVNDLKSKLEERLEDTSRMDCYLFYVYGKLYEKIDEDVDIAIDWYQKGVDTDTDSCLKNHLLCNEGWRYKCQKRLQKLQKRKGLRIAVVNKNQED